MKGFIQKVEASAGSGKTHYLSQMILTRLFSTFLSLSGRDSSELHRLLAGVLALTFTNKAAAEMKERVTGFLREFSLAAKGKCLEPADRECLEKIASQLGLGDADIVKNSAPGLFAAIVSHYDDFNVRTIDSMLNNVIRVISPDLGLPPDLETALSWKEDLDQALLAFISRSSKTDWDSLEKLIEFIWNSDGFPGWQVENKIITKLSELFDLSRQKNWQPDSAAQAGSDSIRTELAELAEKLGILQELINESAPEGGLNPNLNGGKVSESFRKKLNDYLALPRTGAVNELISLSFFKRENSLDLLKKKHDPGYAERFSRSFSQSLTCLRRVIMVIAEQFSVPYLAFFEQFQSFWNQERKKLYVAEFSRLLQKNLSDWSMEAFPYLYLKLSDRYRHFLFDEFQDTSELQFKALSPLIDETLSATERASLFLVGDRKQAIYRWRGGCADLMNEAALRREVPAIDHLAPDSFSEELNANWRSRREIVRFNNLFWAADSISQTTPNPELQDMIRNNFSNSGQIPARDAAGGLVRIQFIPSENPVQAEEEEIDDIPPCLASVPDAVEEFRNLGFQNSDIAVLAVKNDQLREIMAILSARGTPCVSSQALLLKSEHSVNELMALVRFLQNPRDDISFHALISGRIFSALPEAEKLDETCLPGRGKKPVYRIYREKHPRAWEKLIEPLRLAAGYLPPYDLLSDACALFRVIENQPQSMPFMLTFLDLVHNLEQQGINSLAALADYWDRLDQENSGRSVALPERIDAVRLLTIHQAKGLEFPVVILPLLMSGSRSQSSANYHLSQDKLVYASKKYAAIVPELRELYQAEISRACLDSLNLLYVATTRARDVLNMIVECPEKEKEPDSTEWQAFANLAEIVRRHPFCRPKEGEIRETRQFGELVTPDAAPGIRPEHKLSHSSKLMLTREWQIERFAFRRRREATGKQSPAAARGERLHNLLAGLGLYRRPEDLLAGLRERSKQLQAEETDIEALVLFLTHASVWPFFSGTGFCSTEVETARSCGAVVETYRIDRLIEKENETWVIEFKTGSERSEDHRRQLLEYMKLVPSPADTRIRGFLLYLEPPQAEEIPWSG